MITCKRYAPSVPPGFAALLAAVLLLLPGCPSGEPPAPPSPPANGTPEARGASGFVLTSTAFEPGGAIPEKYTGNGPDLSPPLAWKGAPAGTRAFVLICDDPDAPSGNWVHWVIYDLDAGRTALEEGLPREGTLAGGARQGRNDWPSDNIGYRGPAPPPGKVHRYFFRLYAVDRTTGLAPGASKEEVLEAIRDRTLARAELMGTYKR